MTAFEYNMPAGESEVVFASHAFVERRVWTVGAPPTFTKDPDFLIDQIPNAWTRAA